MRATIVPLAFLSAFLAFGVVEPRSLAQQPAQPCPGKPNCNANDEDDRCDVSCSNSGIYCVGGVPVNDLCNSGWFPSCGTSADCNENDVPDECESVAIWLATWVHPCAGDPANTLSCNMTGWTCWCPTDWNLPSNWVAGLVPDCQGKGRIEHSNPSVGACVGGDRDGLPCASDAECPGGDEEMPACRKEKYLLIATPTTTIAGLELWTKGTPSPTDSLTVTFKPQGVSATLTAGFVELDGFNGSVTLKADPGATIDTLP